MLIYGILQSRQAGGQHIGFLRAWTISTYEVDTAAPSGHLPVSQPVAGCSTPANSIPARSGRCLPAEAAMRSNQVVPPPASGAPAAVRAELMSHASHAAVLDERAHVCATWQRLQVPAWRAFFAGVGDLQTWVPVTKEQVGGAVLGLRDLHGYPMNTRLVSCA